MKLNYDENPDQLTYRYGKLQKLVEEFDLSGKDFAKVEIDPDRKRELLYESA